eukprot:115301-Hanusia_phi.AAC.5
MPRSKHSALRQRTPELRADFTNAISQLRQLHCSLLHVDNSCSQQRLARRPAARRATRRPQPADRAAGVSPDASDSGGSDVSGRITRPSQGNEETGQDRCPGNDKG